MSEVSTRALTLLNRKNFAAKLQHLPVQWRQ
jgi:hypothetical protein